MEQVLQNGGNPINLPYPNSMDYLKSNALSNNSIGTGIGGNYPPNVDLRRQSIRHLSGMIKCTPQDTELITEAVIIGLFSSDKMNISKKEH